MRCPICNKNIFGDYVLFNGQNIHVDCFRCHMCNLPIKETFVLYENRPYHNACYSESFGIKCSICNEYIKGSYLFDDFGNCAHPVHNNVQTIICRSCGRFFMNNNLKLCNTCKSLIVETEQQVKNLFLGIISFFDGMKVSLNSKNIVVEIASQEKFSKLLEKADNTLGVTQTTLFTFGFSQKYEHRIYVIEKLPDIEFCGVLAHELMHTWLNEEEILLDDYQSEGICNLVSYLYYCEIKTKHSDYLIKRIYEDKSEEYGNGFRFIKSIYNAFGFNKLLEMAKKTKKGTIKFDKDTKDKNNIDDFSSEIENIGKPKLITTPFTYRKFDIKDIFNDFNL